MENIELATANNDMPIYQASQYSTVEVHDAQTRKMVANAANNATSLSEIGNAVFEAIGVMTKLGVRRSRDKNVPDAPCTDCIILCTNGKAYFTKSEGIRKALDNLVGMGIFEDGEPVKMRVVTSQLQNGNTLKTLELV